MRQNKILIDDYIVDDLINSYGDNINNVINEIEKIYLITRNRKIKHDDYLSTYKNRNIKYWNLMDMLGKKKYKESIEIFDNLIQNGFSPIPIINNLTNFYLGLLNNNMKNNYKLNNTIKKRINLYLNNYNINEIYKILIELRNMDIIIKSSSINVKSIFHPFILKISKGHYGAF